MHFRLVYREHNSTEIAHSHWNPFDMIFRANRDFSPLQMCLSLNNPVNHQTKPGKIIS